MKAFLLRSEVNGSLEYSTVLTHDAGATVAGTILLRLEGEPAHIIYRIETDHRWRTRQVMVREGRGAVNRALELAIDETQTWKNGEQTVTFADGLFDVDLQISPMTNTLPLRRLNLKIGQTVEVDAVWVKFPGLTLERLSQRYTRVGHDVYQYEAPALDFRAELHVDDEHVIVRYGDLWRRV